MPHSSLTFSDGYWLSSLRRIAWEGVKHADEVAQIAFQMATYPRVGPQGQIFSLAHEPM